MKKLLLLVFFISATVVAQKGERHEKIKALKIAHLTEALDLSGAEAEEFWPIYNAHEEKMHLLRKSEREDIHRLFKNGGIDALSDTEANKLIDKFIDIKSKMVAYETALIEDLRKVLPPKKIIKLKKAEEDFKRQLLKQIRQKRGKR